MAYLATMDLSSSRDFFQKSLASIFQACQDPDLEELRSCASQEPARDACGEHFSHFTGEWCFSFSAEAATDLFPDGVQGRRVMSESPAGYDHNIENKSQSDDWYIGNAEFDEESSLLSTRFAVNIQRRATKAHSASGNVKNQTKKSSFLKPGELPGYKERPRPTVGTNNVAVQLDSPRPFDETESLVSVITEPSQLEDSFDYMSSHFIVTVFSALCGKLEDVENRKQDNDRSKINMGQEKLAYKKLCGKAHTVLGEAKKTASYVYGQLDPELAEWGPHGFCGAFRPDKDSKEAKSEPVKVDRSSCKNNHPTKPRDLVEAEKVEAEKGQAADNGVLERNEALLCNTLEEESKGSEATTSVYIPEVCGAAASFLARDDDRRFRASQYEGATISARSKFGQHLLSKSFLGDNSCTGRPSLPRREEQENYTPHAEVRSTCSTAPSTSLLGTEEGSGSVNNVPREDDFKQRMPAEIHLIGTNASSSECFSKASHPNNTRNAKGNQQLECIFEATNGGNVPFDEEKKDDDLGGWVYDPVVQQATNARYGMMVDLDMEELKYGRIG